MSNKKLRILIFAIVVIVTGLMFKDMLSQPGIESLKGGFEQVAAYRNQNNTGPVQRIYAVTVRDTIEAELLAYGNFMPHSKYGNTKVYFFLKGTQTPTRLMPGNINFDAKYNSACFAVFEKAAMGNFALKKNPFSPSL